MKECCAAYLNEQFGGDADVVNEIYTEYVSSAKDKVTEAEMVLADEQWDLLDKVAHTIKGNALAAGDVETANIGIALRSEAKLHNATAAATLIAKLKELTATL